MTDDCVTAMQTWNLPGHLQPLHRQCHQLQLLLEAVGQVLEALRQELEAVGQVLEAVGQVLD